jgi:hypothetical protein
MDIATRDFRKPLEVFELVFRSVNTEKSVTVAVKVNPLVFQSLRIGHWINLGLMWWTVAINIVLALGKHIYASIVCRRDIANRAKSLAREIERLSKSKFSSVGLQATLAPRAPAGEWGTGKWICTSAGALPVSKDGMVFLTHFLRELN